MRQIELLYSQDKFIFSPYKFPALVGTWGCGKSIAALHAMNNECNDFKNNLALVIRKEFVDLRDSTYRDWKAEIGTDWNGDKDIHYPNGSVLMFRHGEDIDSLKNINLGAALIVQAEEMREEEFWFLVGRLRRQSGSLKLRIEANYNGHNWIHKLWKKKDIKIPHELEKIISKDDFHLIESNTLENQANLPKAYLASLEMLPDKLKRRHFFGTWDDAQGLVYDEYSENRHCITPFVIPDSWEKGFVLDHGFRNPTGVLWYAIDYDGIIYLYDEHYESEKPISYHAEKIKQRGILSGYCDPSIFNKTQSRGNKIYSIADEYQDLGITLRPASNSNENASIARVNEFFKDVRIKVFNHLEYFKEEISNWKWKVSNSRMATNDPETPEDLANHLMDCLKYLIASRFPQSEKPTEKIEKYSLDYFDKQAEYAKEQRELARASR